jgi:hypothetical protein
MASRSSHVSDSDPSNCVVDERVKAGEVMYFPYRVCLDGDVVRQGCIYGVAVHLDNIGMECILDSIWSEQGSYQAKLTNPTEYDRWLVVNAPYHEGSVIRFEASKLPIHRVNEGVMGVLIPPFSTGVLECKQRVSLFPQLGIASVVGLLALFLLVSSGRAKHDS